MGGWGWMGSFFLSFFFICYSRVTLHPAQGYLPGKCGKSQTLALPHVSVRGVGLTVSLPAPVCPGPAGWEVQMHHAPGSPTPAHAPFSHGIPTRHNSKKKLIKISRWRWQGIEPQRGALCDCHEADLANHCLPILLTSQNCFHLSPCPAPPTLTKHPGCRQADPHLTGKPAVIPNLSAALQPASVPTVSHTPPSLFSPNQNF